jgi:hypothetical protein
VQVTAAHEDDMSFFPVITNDVHFDSPVIPVPPVKLFHTSRPFSFIAEKAPTMSPAGW